jgi:L-ascorbate metabolism protein UlaG (beta-lactamase superfamily)
MEVINGVDLVIVSHLHADHFDLAAQDMLPKDIPMFCQPNDAGKFKKFGFKSVASFDKSISWNDIGMTRISGQHGTGAWGERMGNVSGFVFKNKNEPTIYWAGDTIWCESVKQAIKEFKPDIIITHSCGAKFPDSDPIIMDAVQTIEVCKESPNSIIIATHMEAVDHATVSRNDLRDFAEKSGISTKQLYIPADGEVLSF